MTRKLVTDILVLGEGDPDNIRIEANTAFSPKPAIVFDQSTNSWKQSNDGVNYKSLIEGHDFNLITPLTNSSYVIPNSINTLILTPPIAVVNYTITMPSEPHDGLEITLVMKDNGIQNLLLNGAFGQSIDPQIKAIKLIPFSFVKYKWVDSLNSWILIDKSNFVTQRTYGFEDDVQTLSAQNILDKNFQLSNIPADPSKVVVIPDGGIPQRNGVDFAVSQNVLYWNGLGLDGFLEENDVLYIRY